MSIRDVDRRAWRALFAAQAGWMLDAMDFLLFTFAIVSIQREFRLSTAPMGSLTTVASIAAALSAAVLGHGGWRVLFLIGAVPALVVFFIRRNVEEPQIWRDRTEPSRWGEMFSRPFLSRTIIATLLASSVLIALWGVITW